MQTILIILVVVLAIGALVSLIRGVVLFMQAQSAEVHGAGPSQSMIRQNRMMWRRIQFQAAAVLVAALLMWMARG